MPSSEKMCFSSSVHPRGRKCPPGRAGSRPTSHPPYGPAGHLTCGCRRRPWSCRPPRRTCLGKGSAGSRTSSRRVRSRRHRRHVRQVPFPPRPLGRLHERPGSRCRPGAASGRSSARAASATEDVADHALDAPDLLELGHALHRHDVAPVVVGHGGWCGASCPTSIVGLPVSRSPGPSSPGAVRRATTGRRQPDPLGRVIPPPCPPRDRIPGDPYQTPVTTRERLGLVAGRTRLASRREIISWRLDWGNRTSSFPKIIPVTWLAGGGLIPGYSPEPLLGSRREVGGAGAMTRALVMALDRSLRHLDGVALSVEPGETRMRCFRKRKEIPPIRWCVLRLVSILMPLTSTSGLKCVKRYSPNSERF